MIDLTILLFGVGINSLIGVLILLYGKKSKDRRLFLIYVTLVVLWIVANYKIDTSATNIEALLWLKILYALSVGYVTTFFIFSIYFLYEKSPFFSAVWYTNIYTATATVITLFSDKVFVSATLGAKGLESVTFGPLYLPNLIIGIFFIIGTIIVLVRKRRSLSDKRTKKQLTAVIVGWSTFFSLAIVIGAILPIFIPKLVNISKFVPLLSIIMVSCTAYAILRYQFLDIRILIQRGLIYTILLTGIVGLYLTVLTTLGIVTQHVAPLVSAAITTIIGIFTVPYIDQYLRRKTDKFFFKDTYNYNEVLYTLSRILNHNISLNTITTKLSQQLREIFKPTFVKISLDVQYRESKNAQMDEILLPIVFEKREIGALHLGAKLSGDDYTKIDRQLLDTLLYQIATSLMRAQLFTKVEDYSKTLEKKVLQRTAQLQKAHEVQHSTIHDISHSLQTPLTILKNEISRLNPHQITKNQHNSLTTTVNDITTFIADFTALIELESSLTTLPMKKINLSQTLHEIIEYMHIITQMKNITLTHSIQPDILIYGSERKLRELFLSIASNAVKYIGADNPKEIHIALTKTIDHAVVTITDTGIGISADIQLLIFNRTYRAPQTKNIQGSGLGLAIAKSITDKHGGTIEVDSTEDKGSMFTITLPLAKPPGDTFC